MPPAAPTTETLIFPCAAVAARPSTSCSGVIPRLFCCRKINFLKRFFACLHFPSNAHMASQHGYAPRSSGIHLCSSALYALFRTSFCLGLCLGCDQGPTPFSPGASEFRRYLFLPGLCTIDARICAIVQHITPLEHSTFQLLSFPPIAVRLSPARLLLVAACPAAAQLRSLKPRHRASPVYGTNEEATYRQARCAASPPGWDA